TLLPYCIALLCLFATGASSLRAQGANTIFLDQIGFYPDQSKLAVVPDSISGAFSVVSENGGDTVLRGDIGPARAWAPAGSSFRTIDFSALREPGTYVLRAGAAASYPFEVREHVHEALLKGAIKGFYYQRVSTPLEARYAGKWARAEGHPDTVVLIHPSAAGPTRAAGAVISAPKGWYDAGDYNKYVVNSGISTYTLLALYEHYPAYMLALAVDIPESDNRVPDVLDEALWNLRWMLAMQDPADGGVYHKLTTAEFSGFVRPEQDVATRYVVQKSTAAALDFAAVMAQASRIFAEYENELPGLADSMRTAAVAAWQWARLHPDVLYRQEELNRMYDPDIETGAYGDRAVADEFSWAAAELFVTTGADSLLDVVGDPGALNVPSWGSVRTLAYYTLARHLDNLPASFDRRRITGPLLALADTLRQAYRTSPLRIPMGAGARDFVWGSNAVAANQGMALIQAFALTKDSTYLDAARANLDYILGRNPTGYSFVTGFGDRTPMHPHHRPSESDDVVDPVPGLLAGGPNPGQQDQCSGYPSRLPALSYLDDQCSYASNEIAINWNAPLVYLTGALEAVLSPDSQPAPQQGGTR
ncbi:MAG TPA: glycoside hydrolase family 9 protein, partial [Rhodothermales bacterium]|nr:glycoside hydrolase family 9 protein [Rhodothermales bacterium]